MEVVQLPGAQGFWQHQVLGGGVIFEIAPMSYVSDSFVECEGYSISSRGFLPTVSHRAGVVMSESSSTEVVSGDVRALSCGAGMW